MKTPKSNGLNKREISLSFTSKPRGMCRGHVRTSLPLSPGPTKQRWRSGPWGPRWLPEFQLSHLTSKQQKGGRRKEEKGAKCGYQMSFKKGSWKLMLDTVSYILLVRAESHDQS